MPTPTSRRAVLGGLSLLATAPVLAACGSTDEAISGSGSTSGAEAGALPVTIEHKYGSTRITRAPKRVVCVGLLEQDAVLALGVVPVGDTKWFDDTAGAIYPWAKPAMGKAPLPTRLDSADGIPVEKVAALAPDLIIGQYSAMTEKEYSLLSKLAPTLAQPKGYVDYGIPWDVSTATIGQALGRPKAGRALVKKVKADISKASAANPSFAGKTAVVVTPYEGLYVYGPEDGRGRMLADLGFTFPPALLHGGTKDFGWSLSAERTADLDDVDVVVWLDYDKLGTGMKRIFTQTRAAKEGRWLSIDASTAGAYSVGQTMVTPLSIPYVLKRYVPQLAAAVDGDPATKVPAVSA